ncbi:MAG: SIR2 family protein [Negativicutes bacterium]|nr:SIR2 family protein [Negativicutes bacterium]
MLDALTSTSFAVHNAKGVYALLLGSGISRAANIPTGWEVTLDLIRRIAATMNESEECQNTPEEWYRSRFKNDPDYSSLLEQLAISPAERTAALARYFDGSNDPDGVPLQPTKAHVAIAKMVSRGYIRVIVTTNFDRLMERALEAQGISPTIIATPDAIQGALPLAHATCTLIKLHGDYRDARLRNTVAELSAYDEQTQSLVDKVLDEYGLIVSGWSATWDIALRNAIMRAENRRFTTVWTYFSTLSSEAEELIQFRQAQTIKVASSDSFFTDLNERLEALETFNAPHPLSVDLAVRMAKKYVAEDRYRVQLYELVMGEAEQAISSFKVNPTSSQITPELYLQEIKHYEFTMERLLCVLINVAYWGEPRSFTCLKGTIERLMGLKVHSGGYDYLIDLQLYPAVLAFYAVGLGFVTAGNYMGFTALLKEFQTGAGELNHKIEPASERLQLQYSIRNDELNRALGKKFYTPGSDRVFNLFAPIFQKYLPSVVDFENLFDRFEYLNALVLADYRASKDKSICGWWGRWAWRNREYGGHISERLKEERNQLGPNWPPINAGLFASVERFDEVLERQRTECLNRFRNF